MNLPAPVMIMPFIVGNSSSEGNWPRTESYLLNSSFNSESSGLVLVLAASRSKAAKMSL